MRWFGWFRRGKGRAGGKAPSEAEVPYVLPHDLEERNRLDFQHYLLRHMLRGNFVAPVRDPREILDVGCGTGRWSIEMAQQFPRANVVGLDVAVPPVEQPRAGVVDTRPDNFVFVQGNALEALPFPDNAFDMVHMRFLFLALPLAQWPSVVGELARVTRPGGWVELVESCVLPPGRPNLVPSRARLDGWICQMLASRGIDSMAGEHLAEFLAGAGLRQVQARQLDAPIGDYGGRLGRMVAADLLSAGEGVKGPVVALGMATADEYDHTMAEVRLSFMQEPGSVQPFYVAYGQKPM